MVDLSRMPLRYEQYVAGVAGRGVYPFNSQGFVEDALRAADPVINYALFDNDGGDGVADTGDDDTMIDLLLCIHAGSGGESGASTTNLQSIAFGLPNPTPFDGVFANNFAIAPEDGRLGVYAHETGHLLGLPDLYDLTGHSFGLGTWSLMAGGWSLDQARTPARAVPAPPTAERNFRPFEEASPIAFAPPAGPAFAGHYEYRVTGPWPFSGAAEAITAGWVRARRPPTVLGAAELVALADAWWPAAFSIDRGPRPTSTIAYMLQLLPTRAPLPGDQPLFHVARAVGGAEGYVAEQRELWTADGELVALNPQTFVVIK